MLFGSRNHASGMQHRGQHADHQQHRRHRGPVDGRPIGAEQLARVAAAGDQAGREQRHQHQHDAAADQLPGWTRWRCLARLDPVVARDVALERCQVLRVVLLQIEQAERGDEAFDQRGAEHVRKQHRRERHADVVRAVQRPTVLVEQRGLHAQLDTHRQRGHGDPDERADARPPTRAALDSSGDRPAISR